MRVVLRIVKKSLLTMFFGNCSYDRLIAMFIMFLQCLPIHTGDNIGQCSINLIHLLVPFAHDKLVTLMVVFTVM